MYQHESAINIRMFPSLLNFPPPPSPPQCSRLSQITGVSSLSHRADTHWHLFLYTAAYMYPCFSLLLSRSSAGKESACNAGDTGLIPGSGRSPGEGIGYLLQYSKASLSGSAGKESTCNAGRTGFDPWVAKIPLEKGKATHSSFLVWRIPRTV